MRIKKYLIRVILNILLKPRYIICIIFIIFFFISYFTKVLFTVCEINSEIIIKNNKFVYNLKDEPIDVVYTWVNGSDVEFLQSLYLFSKSTEYKDNKETLKYRFDDKHELKYSLRSLEKFAPWINHVYIVTNGQIPHWLNLEYDKVTIITHEQIFPDLDDLPTFSSAAIESHLHRIPNLSTHFLYFNDDIFLNSHIYLEDFVTENNGYKIYLSWPVPNCNEGCPWIYIHDGMCDTECNVELCLYDGYDCINNKPSGEEYNFIEEIENQEKILIIPEENVPMDIENKYYNNTSWKFDTTITHDKKHKFNEYIKKFNETEKNFNKTVKNYNKIIMQRNKTRRKRFQNLQNSFLAKNSTLTVPISEHDAYAMSLIHVNNIFNLRYIFQSRRAIAHMPIFLNKNIIQELLSTFDSEFKNTSRNKFRANNDMQFEFSYSYFLIHEMRNVSIEEIFEFFDTDLSGTWSDREIRTLLTRLHDLPLDYEMISELENILINCSINIQFESLVPSTPQYERYIDSKLPTISKELVQRCRPLKRLLSKKYSKVSKYKYEILKNSHNEFVSFKMLTSNLTHVVGNLDEIRKFPKKFVCLNDNMDSRKIEENNFVRTILNDFYLSLFPHPSKFELPNAYRNRFTNMQDLRNWKLNRYKLKICIYILIMFFFGFLLFTLCKLRYFYRLKRHFYF